MTPDIDELKKRIDELAKQEKENLREIDNYLITEYKLDPTIEKILNEFIEVVLKDRPIHAYDELDTELQELIARERTMDDDLVRDTVKQMLKKDDRVVWRAIEELEIEELDDPVFPNEWLYHRDKDEREVVKYILHYYDSFRKEDELEERLNDSSN